MTYKAVAEVLDYQYRKMDALVGWFLSPLIVLNKKPASQMIGRFFNVNGFKGCYKCISITNT